MRTPIIMLCIVCLLSLQTKAEIKPYLSLRMTPVYKHSVYTETSVVIRKKSVYNLPPSAASFSIDDDNKEILLVAGIFTAFGIGATIYCKNQNDRQEWLIPLSSVVIMDTLLGLKWKKVF